MICEITHFAYSGATVCMLSHRHLSAPTRKSSPFTSVLRTRIIRALPLFRHQCRIYVVETQTCRQALSLLSAFNTVHSVHISGDYAKTLFRNTHPSNITYIRTWVSSWSNIAFIKNVLQMCCRKKRNSSIFLQR